MLVLLGLPSAPALAPGAGAQDVEMLGEQHGTRPPDAYFEELARNPRAFSFEREGRERLLHLQQWRSTTFPDLILRYGGEARSLGPRDVPVVGPYRFPLVLGLFADTPEEPPYDHEHVQREYFDGPNTYGQTITELYDDMSGGRLELEGVAFPWVRTDLTGEEVTRNASGLISHSTEGIGAFIEEIVRELDEQGVDWSEFDNTGDGFVDVLAVMHFDWGAECGGGPDRIWSHRWNLDGATQGRLDPGVQTSTPRDDGSGFIYVNDYTIQGVRACRSDAINQIGVFAHELGHGFGLPDLYETATNPTQPGVGRWDLMATGGWGCRNDADPARPCHLGAWSKAVLGWVDVIDIEPDTDYGTLTLPPVQTSNEVLRIPSAAGSSEYLLLENRQRVGTQVRLWEPGLLIWRIAPDLLEATWSLNRVNSTSGGRSVWLQQADGEDELGIRSFSGEPNHGDAGDPFPGETSNVRFHAGTSPAARDREERPFGVTIGAIRLVGAEPYHVRLDLSTRLTRITLDVEGEGEAPGGTFRADGEPVGEAPALLLSVPFDERTLEAPPGGEISDGVRVGFAGWSDGGPRLRELTTPESDTTLTVAYAGEELRLEWIPTSSEDSIEPGSLDTDPASFDLWFARGTEVEIEANARSGFSFREWTGALAGRSNPTTIQLDDPFTAEAAFDYEYGFVDPPTELDIEAAAPNQIRFTLREAVSPIQWRVVEGEFPEGMGLSGDRIRGPALEMGEFTVTIRARDATGLEAHVQLLLRVGPPRIGMDRLAGAFLENGLEPTVTQKHFMDLLGNDDGRYDVGDLRAFLRVVPDPPEVTPSSPAAAPHEVLLRVRADSARPDPEGGR